MEGDESQALRAEEIGGAPKVQGRVFTRKEQVLTLMKTPLRRELQGKDKKSRSVVSEGRYEAILINPLARPGRFGIFVCIHKWSVKHGNYCIILYYCIIVFKM